MTVWKVLMVWLYMSYIGILPACGFTILLITFVAIALTAGPELLSQPSNKHANH